MTHAALLRLAGAALIVALPLSIPGYVVHPRTHELADVVASTTSLSHAIVALGWMLVLLGLPGLYAFHAHRSGVIGLVGFILMMSFAAFHIYLLLALVPAATRESLLDLGYANIGLGLSYVLLNTGLAIAGYELWRRRLSGPDLTGDS